MLNSHQQYMSDAISLHPCQHLGAVTLLGFFFSYFDRYVVNMCFCDWLISFSTV